MRTLRRPMFRRGGSAGEGITSGLKRQGYDNGNTVQPRRPNTNLNNFLIDFGLDLVSRPPQGGFFSTAASAAKDPFKRFQARDVAQKDREYERQFIEEQIDQYWDPLIEAELDPEKKRLLLQEKAADKYNVIVMGADISDKYKILSNAQATEQAVSSAETEIGNTINPDTNVNWVETDAGYSEKLQTLINKYLRLATKFLEEVKKADGGRIGRAVGGSMTEDVNVMTKTPGGIADINVSETVERDPEQTNQIDISYEQLRDRLPAEISNEIVLLLSESYEAFSDFAEIQTQADVNEFNTKYNVQLFLPQQSGV